MGTVADAYGLKHDTYAPLYKRVCPICGNEWPTSKMAIRCWYLEGDERGGGKRLAGMPIAHIAEIMGVSDDAVRRTWRYLEEEFDAPIRPKASGGPGVSYDSVVHYLRRRRQNRHGPERGWTEKLATQLGISRQRVSQLHIKALERGDIQ